MPALLSAVAIEVRMKVWIVSRQEDRACECCTWGAGEKSYSHGGPRKQGSESTWKFYRFLLIARRVCVEPLARRLFASVQRKVGPGHRACQP